MKVILCSNCAHHKKDHDKLGCSPSCGMTDFIGIKDTVCTMSYSCECRKFVEDTGIYINFRDTLCDSWESDAYGEHIREINEQQYCQLLEDAGLL